MLSAGSPAIPSEGPGPGSFVEPPVGLEAMSYPQLIPSPGATLAGLSATGSGPAEPSAATAYPCAATAEYACRPAGHAAGDPGDPAGDRAGGYGCGGVSQDNLLTGFQAAGDLGVDGAH